MQYRLVCFDLDQTLVDDSDELGYWGLLHRELDNDTGHARNKQRMDDFLAKRITYEEWVRLDIEDFQRRGLKREDFVRVAKQQGLMKGAHETVQALTAKGVKLAVISGSLDILLDTLFPEHPFDDVYLNTVRFAADGGIEGWEATRFDHGRKHEALRWICDREGIPFAETVFVGDGLNDVDALEAAGLGIAFCPKEEAVARAANVTLREKDLRLILPYILKV